MPEGRLLPFWEMAEPVFLQLSRSGLPVCRRPGKISVPARGPRRKRHKPAELAVERQPLALALQAQAVQLALRLLPALEAAALEVRSSWRDQPRLKCFLPEAVRETAPEHRAL